MVVNLARRTSTGFAPRAIGGQVKFIYAVMTQPHCGSALARDVSFANVGENHDQDDPMSTDYPRLEPAALLIALAQEMQKEMDAASASQGAEVIAANLIAGAQE